MPLRKKALLIGVSYTGQTNMELKGTKNDTMRLRHKLIEKFGYKDSEIVMLIEDQPGYKPPTGRNILNALIKMIIATRRGLVDECFIQFSGHGSSLICTDGSEADGMDEVLIPKDWKERGVITDDLLSHYFRYFSSKCRVICALDCCHSASLLDLRYEMKDSGEIVTVNEHSTHRCDCIMISGCRDFECSLDVVQKTSRFVSSWGGLMTYSILQVLDDTDHDLTWLELLTKSREYIKERGHEQIPQLSCSKVVSDKCKVCVSHDGGKTLDFDM